MNDTLIQKQVCTLEKSRKLKELGFLQNSLFHHLENWKTNEIPNLVFDKTRKHYEYYSPISAYTETELKAFMPYGRTYPNLSVQEQADFLIKLIEFEGMHVEEYNQNYKEFFDIE